MLIEGFGIAGYRSFGPKLQRVGPLEKINLFIGQNNCGKSNILLFLANHYLAALQSIRGRAQWSFDPLLDRPLGDQSGKLVIELCVKLEGDLYASIKEKYQNKLLRNSLYLQSVGRIFKSKTLTHGTKAAWFRYEGAWGSTLSMASGLIEDIHAENALNEQEWSTLWNTLTDQGRGNIKQHWIPETLRILSSEQKLCQTCIICIILGTKKP